MKWTCLECGLELDEYSRPHRAPETEAETRRSNYLLTHSWANYDDMPKSIRMNNDRTCWSTVVNTLKYNRPTK